MCLKAESVTSCAKREREKKKIDQNLQPCLGANVNAGTRANPGFEERFLNHRLTNPRLANLTQD